MEWAACCLYRIAHLLATSRGRRSILNAPEASFRQKERQQAAALPDSDFDLLVIKESDEPRYRRSAPLYVALADVPAEVEVMVYTPEEVEEWSQVPQAFVTTAVREGTTIYERPGGTYPRAL